MGGCEHTLHHLDSVGNLCGSWGQTPTKYGLRISCKVCGKFYGYSPNQKNRRRQVGNDQAKQLAYVDETVTARS